jgi:hypothetical protein
MFIYYVVWSFAVYNQLPSYKYIRVSYSVGHTLLSRSADWPNLLGIPGFLQKSAEKRLKVASFNIFRIQLSMTLQAYIRSYSIRAK